MTEIQDLKIEDVCDFIGGSQPPKSEFLDHENEGYVRLVQTRDFKTQEYKTYIPKNSTSKFFTKTDIMIGRYGPPVFQIFRGLEGAYNVALLKAKPKKNILNDYLYYYLKQQDILRYVDRLSARTGGQTGVDLVSLNKYPIQLPNISVQKQIALVLSALDDKIELNNRINQELEGMAKLLYDYWFVQFDFPDANGKPYKSAGGKMVYDEVLKREVPEGWELEVLDNAIIGILDYRGRTPKKLGADWSENIKDIIALSAKHVKDGKLINLENANRVSEELYKVWMRQKLLEGDILMTSEAPCGEFFYLIGKTEFCLSQRLFAIRANEGIIKSSYLYFELSKGNGYSQILGKQSGSTVSGIRQDELKKVLVLIPSLKLQEKFDKDVKTIFRKIRNNDYQNQKLAELRDWLLPMLMNGQVKVGGVEEGLNLAAEPEVGYGE